MDRTRRRPLEGFRILDLTRAYAGPIGTRMLADLGAEVIKVEAVQRLDMGLRLFHFAENNPGRSPWDRAGYFHRINANKLGIALDLTRPEGVAVFKALVKISDVVAENYSPGVMKEFGLGYEALRALNPSIILVDMSGFGQDGPRCHWLAFAGGMEAEGGLAAVAGYPDGGGVGSGTGHGDWVLGASGMAAVLTALVHRQRTGEGQQIDVAGREAIACLIGELFLDYSANGCVAAPRGNLHERWVPYGCFPCRDDDEWVTIAVTSDGMWERLVRAMGSPPWTEDPRYATAAGRLELREELDRLLGEWTQGQDKEEVGLKLRQAGVAAAPVQKMRDVLMDEHLKQTGMLEVIEHPLTGPRPFPRQVPVAFEGYDSASPMRHAPLLGEHNSLVLRELLGMPVGEYDALVASQVTGTQPVRPPRSRPLDLEGWQRSGAVVVDRDYLKRLSDSYGRALGPRMLAKRRGAAGNQVEKEQE